MSYDGVKFGWGVTGLQSLGGLFEIVEHCVLLLFWEHPSDSGDDE